MKNLGNEVPCWVAGLLRQTYCCTAMQPLHPKLYDLYNCQLVVNTVGILNHALG